MKKYFIMIVIVIVLVSLAGAAFALMPPYSKEELEKESTNIIQGKVIGLAMIDKYKSKENDRKYEYTRYCAWMMVEKSYKGDLKKNDTILIKWKWRQILNKEPGFIDESYHNPAYYAGEIVKSYLKKYGDYYDSVWWNAKENVNLKYAVMTMPKEPGQVVYPVK